MLVLLRWWFIFCLSMFGAFLAYQLGFYNYLLQSDKSYMGITAISVFTIISLWVGQLTYQARNGDQAFKRHLPLCWYFSESLMGLGMIGTLVGFLMLLGTALGQPINVADTAAMTALIAKMGIGFSTAAVTTLVGLVCSLILKLQLLNLEYQVKN